MSTSFVDIDRDEMEYVDGGFSIWNGVISFGVNAFVSAIFGAGTIGTLRTMVNALGKQGSINIIKDALKKWVSVQVANKVAGFLGGQLMGFLTFSVGGFVSTVLDRYDGDENGKWTVC